MPYWSFATTVTVELPPSVVMGVLAVTVDWLALTISGFTVTVKLFDPTLLNVSVAVQVTVVVPNEKNELDNGLQTTGPAKVPLSVAVAVKDTVAPPRASATTVMFAGTVTTGGVVSGTMTPLA